MLAQLGDQVGDEDVAGQPLPQGGEGSRGREVNVEAGAEQVSQVVLGRLLLDLGVVASPCRKAKATSCGLDEPKIRVRRPKSWPLSARALRSSSDNLPLSTCRSISAT